MSTSSAAAHQRPRDVERNPVEVCRPDIEGIETVLKRGDAVAEIGRGGCLACLHVSSHTRRALFINHVANARPKRLPQQVDIFFGRKQHERRLVGLRLHRVEKL